MTVTRTLLALGVAAGLLPAAPAMAFCSKPITPHCASDGTLADSYMPEEQCRRAVKSHLEDLTRYRSCLTAEIEQVEEAAERFRDLLGESSTKSRVPPALPLLPGAEATG